MFVSAVISRKIVFEGFSFAMCYPDFFPSYGLVFLFPTPGLADISEKRVCYRASELTPMYTFTYTHIYTNEVSLRRGGVVGELSIANCVQFRNPECGWFPTVGDSRAGCPT